MHQTWEEFLAEQRATGCLAAIEAEVQRLRDQRPTKLPNGEEVRAPAIYPPTEDIFRAFDLTPLSEVKVVILGQDPYHGPGQAQGLAFSVPQGIRQPPSLRNILQELADDIEVSSAYPEARDQILSANDLTPWARRGVLLLNTALTVVEGWPRSHLGLWRPFIEAVIHELVYGVRPALLPVFVLWGKPSRDLLEREVGALKPLPSLEGVLRASNTYAVASAHPSPLSAKAGFFGSRPFSKVNRVLTLLGQEPVDWRLP